MGRDMGQTSDAGPRMSAPPCSHPHARHPVPRRRADVHDPPPRPSRQVSLAVTTPLKTSRTRTSTNSSARPAPRRRLERRAEQQARKGGARRSSQPSPAVAHGRLRLRRLRPRLCRSMPSRTHWAIFSPPLPTCRSSCCSSGWVGSTRGRAWGACSPRLRRVAKRSFSTTAGTVSCMSCDSDLTDREWQLPVQKI